MDISTVFTPEWQCDSIDKKPYSKMCQTQTSKKDSEMLFCVPNYREESFQVGRLATNFSYIYFQGEFQHLKVNI